MITDKFRPAYGREMVERSTAEPAAPCGTLQSQSAHNLGSASQINAQLAAIRARLFGECETAKDAPSPLNAPMQSLSGSISATEGELLQSMQQLDSILERL